MQPVCRLATSALFTSVLFTKIKLATYNPELGIDFHTLFYDLHSLFCLYPLGFTILPFIQIHFSHIQGQYYNLCG